ERGIERFQLASQERRARGDLVRLRVAIVRRPALHDVRDEHILPSPADRGQELDEEPAGATHKRPALAVLIEARALAHEHDFGVWIAFAGDRASALLVETTAGADANLRRDLLERSLALAVRHAPPLRGAVPAARSDALC